MALQQSLIATLQLILPQYGASVSSLSPTPSSMPVTNLFDYRPQMIASFTNLANSECTLDLTSPLSAGNVVKHGISSYRYLLIIGANISSTGTVEVFLGNNTTQISSAVLATLHTSPRVYWATIENNVARYPRRHAIVDLGSQRTELLCRVKFSDPSNAYGHLDVGLIIPSPGYIPTLPLTKQPSRSLSTSNSGSVVTQAGSRQTRPQPKFRTVSYTMQVNGSASARQEVINNHIAIQELVGLDDPLVVITNLSPTSNYMDDFIYGTLQDVASIDLPEIFGAVEINYKVMELK
jgi:hypothetical protein